MSSKILTISDGSSAKRVSVKGENWETDYNNIIKAVKDKYGLVLNDACHIVINDTVIISSNQLESVLSKESNRRVSATLVVCNLNT